MPRYELSKGTSNKFWVIDLRGSSHTVTFGRIGTQGTSKTKSFPNAAAAKQDYDKLIAEKTNKGYRLVGDAEGKSADGHAGEPQTAQGTTGPKSTETSPTPKRATEDGSGDALAKLMKLIPPPKEPRDAKGDWKQVESALGTPLPADYRQLVERYGSAGSFADFLTILNPFASNRNINLAYAGPRALEALMPVSEDDAEAMRKLGFQWSAAGIMIVGQTDNGDYVFWIREGSPDEWRIGVRGNEALDDASAYRFGLAEFLYRWLSNRLDVPAFPRDDVFDGKVPAIYRG